MNFTISFVIVKSSDFTNSVISTGKNSKNGAHTKNVMKMRNDVIRVV